VDRSVSEMFEAWWVCASLAQMLSSLYHAIRYLSLAKMLREVMRDDMAFDSASSLSGAAIIATNAMVAPGAA